jgi:tetratricopeptide (TPR) repeat protein
MLAMARVQLANKRPDIAKALLERLSTAAGYNTSRLMQIANLQVYAGALDAAAWSLKKAVDSDTSHVPAHVELIATLIRLERYDAAMAAAEALRAAAPDKAASFGALGEVLAATSRHDEALEQFRKAHELGANELTATKFALAQGRVNQVVADDWLTQWVKDNPEHRLARRMLAERHLQKGDYELAQSDYEQLVKWHSADAGVFNNYAHILKRLGDPRALEIAERAQELAPNDPNINDTLGWMLVEAGDPQRGLAFLRNAHSRAGLNPAIRYHIAVALSKLDRRDEAQRELQRALASPRSFREREQAEELLRTMSK